MSHRQILFVIYGLMAGMFLSSLDQTIVGTAIRTIGDDLHGLDQQAWVTTAYLITSTISVPIYGKLSDIFGRRPLFIFGISVFILGSVLSTFSTSMIMLAGFRAFQGIGAGALMSLPLAIMADILAPRERAKYQGYFFAVFGVSSLIGPLVGGLFAGADQILWIAGWRWVFLINLPIGIIALAMVIAFLHLPKVAKHDNPRIDWWGATAVIVALVPLLLVAEQGREWGWASAGAIACYVIGGVGAIAFVLIEIAMKNDAIIPMRLFRSSPFSMATVIGVLVGFGMFGAMMTIPLYMQIVIGLNPTESGLAMLPMVLGLMISSMAAGQITARTGKYGFFPRTGTIVTAAGFLVLAFVTDTTPVWYLMTGMFVVGLGLGQLMQSLTMASQNAVEAPDMGVATSAATFFRQIGGTLGTAIMLSVLFTLLPTNIQHATADRHTLDAGLNAALNPTVASAPANRAIMDQMWNPIVDPIKKNVQAQLDEGSAKAKAAAGEAVTKAVTEKVQQGVSAGAIPAEAAQTVIDQQVAAATPAAEEQALQAVADKAHASVADGKVSVDWSNASQRDYWSAQLSKTLSKEIDKKASGGSNGSSASTSDTSFLNGADPRLSKPFMVGFTEAIVVIYWIGFGVLLLAFVLSWFFKAPPLRRTSALQEQADAAGRTETGTIRVQGV
ncbi:MFS transporter [Leucobacter sp. OLJS4]|nr:MFS transporter [Leucobacter sp. OLCALW19]PII91688.1 MFS transporter [Leucobacter sp. OLTLW20]PII92027.1 MFS transporter [Leucobacter sp. OLAS13]PIJ00339.1 MFS transporter [Leucobacter sp. OLDS2]PIJ00408.1 MFS transporter [Leucobacter sp. OLCS4]PIJ04551.1 MFS transporter [Leucobacter sp. OLIS6]PIJ13853.1 MFS transporter [Leucobacter sp. OLJS4]PIJ53907.1 MFS transporter [Leucobacter sp. OAMSW11]PIO50366.1 MFS transporter [Leucobacter sp. OAMLP11]